MRWKRWAIVVAGLLAVYALAGFWLVPVLVRHQASSFGKTELARQVSVGEVRFNRFTLRLEAKDIALAEADGAPLLSVSALAVQLEAAGQVQRRLRPARGRPAVGARQRGAGRRRNASRSEADPVCAGAVAAVAAVAGAVPEAEDRRRDRVGAWACQHRRRYGREPEAALCRRARCRRPRAQ